MTWAARLRLHRPWELPGAGDVPVRFYLWLFDQAASLPACLPWAPLCFGEQYPGLVSGNVGIAWPGGVCPDPSPAGWAGTEGPEGADPPAREQQGLCQLLPACRCLLGCTEFQKPFSPVQCNEGNWPLSIYMSNPLCFLRICCCKKSVGCLARQFIKNPLYLSLYWLPVTSLSELQALLLPGSSSILACCSQLPFSLVFSSLLSHGDFFPGLTAFLEPS